MHPRYIEAIKYLHPEINWSGFAPSKRPVMIEDDGSGPVIVRWDLPGEPPTDQDIIEALAEKDAASATETTRAVELSANPGVRAWATRLSAASNAEIDAYFAANVTNAASAIAVIKNLTKIISILLAREIKKNIGE